MRKKLAKNGCHYIVILQITRIKSLSLGAKKINSLSRWVHLMYSQFFHWSKSSLVSKGGSDVPPLSPTWRWKTVWAKWKQFKVNLHDAAGIVSIFIDYDWKYKDTKNYTKDTNRNQPIDTTMRTFVPSIFIAGVQPPSPHPKSPM